MAEVFLVRHGQASFGSKNYDQLSELGIRQCQLLGQQMRHFIKTPTLVTGSLVRHQQSMNAFSEGFSLASESSIELPEMNEFDHQDVFNVAFPEYRDKNALLKAIGQHEQPKKAFHFLFQDAVQRWSSGLHDSEYQESWPVFQSRVIQGLAALKDLACSEIYRKTPLFVFTSGGPISVILKEILGLNDSATFAINENLANSGVTRILLTESKISVSYFNNFRHLELQPNLISYR